MSKKKPAIAVRNPAASADAFVARVGKRASKSPVAAKAAKHPDVQTSKHPDAQTPNTSIRTRRDGTVVQRCSIYFPLPVKRALAIRAAETGRDESDLATEAVCALLGIDEGGAKR